VKIRVDVNEETQEADVAPRTLLVHWLREDLALTGTHIGCETSLCGTCTVHVDDRAVKRCTMFAVQGLGQAWCEEVLYDENGQLMTATLMDYALPRAKVLAGGMSLIPARKHRQPTSGFAIVGAAVQLTADRKGRIDQIRIGVTGVNPMPFRATSVEAWLVGQSPDAAALRALCAWIDEADPAGDLHASAESRSHLAGVFVARAVEKAIEHAKE
jgi:xanthine dehydrogenase iron-sulfur cluster and FAD-binding subunit A